MSTYKLSICIVALNEEVHLPSLLQNIREQLYPHELTEIVLVDSGSSDGTKSIMKSFALEKNDFYNVQVLDNPKRIQAAGWNVAIMHATGDVISRIDAHTMIPAEFSERVMAEIDIGESVVGGIRPCIIENQTPWGKTLLATENSMFGSGINDSKHSNDKKYVKTMFHASYRREVFDKVGLFNEKLLRTEDNEMHYRIRRAGYKLCYNPDIVSFQYARSSLIKMIKQKYGNGYWIGLTLGVCPQCISVYHLIPFVFLLGVLLTSLLACFGYWLLATLMWSLYGLFGIYNTVVSALKEKLLPYLLCMPFLFLVLHLSYGIGTMIGIISLLKKRKSLLAAD